MAEKINVGIIGCGAVAHRKHMPSLLQTGKVNITAFFDVREEMARSAMEKYGAEGAKVYGSVEELLANPDITAVHVCTNPGSHKELVIKALEAGKHVMCEKPMALNGADAEAMAETARRVGKKLTIGFQNRYRNDAQYLKKAIERGDLGDIYFAKALAVRRRSVPVWQLKSKEEQGGGPILDIGTHALDLTLYLMNNFKPKYVVGNTYHELAKRYGETNKFGAWDPEKFFIEDSAFGFVTMENGATVSIESSWALNVREEGEARSLLCGTNGGADMGDGLFINGTDMGAYYTKRVTFDLGRYNGSEIVPPQPRTTHYPLAINRPDKAVDYLTLKKIQYTSADFEADQWIEAIINDTDPIVKPEEGVAVVKILDGLKQSALTGKPVYFD